MNERPILSYMTSEPEPSRPGALADLAEVELVRAAETDEGHLVPIGTRGTVVGVWAGGEAYEVEFSAPILGLATVEASGLRAVEANAA